MKGIRIIIYYLLGAISYFILDLFFFRPIQKGIGIASGSWALGHIVAYLLTIIPLAIASILIYRSPSANHRQPSQWFGLKNKVLPGLLFGFACTLPMLIGFSIIFTIDRNLTLDDLIILTISSAFFEEVIFRGFLFGMLYKYARWKFFPAVLLGSVLFGLVHLYQASDVLEAGGIFLITFLGSLLFSWVYAEWKLNLWFALFLHFFMNLNWTVFAVDENALGGPWANILRLSTLAIAVFTTLWKNKKRYGKWSVVFQKSPVT